MAAKKSKSLSKSPEKKSVPKENISDNGTLKLSEIQRLTLNWEGAELRSIKATLRMKLSEQESYLKRVDPQGLLRKMQSDIASLEAASKVFESKFAASCLAASSALGMDPNKKWSYDDQTGLVHLEDEAKSS